MMYNLLNDSIGYTPYYSWQNEHGDIFMDVHLLCYSIKTTYKAILSLSRKHKVKLDAVITIDVSDPFDPNDPNPLNISMLIPVVSKKQAISILELAAIGGNDIASIILEEHYS